MDSRFIKDPEAELDYSFNWNDWLDTTSTPPESIVSHVITVPDDLTLISSEKAGGVITVWLKGGTPQLTHRVECLITTSAGRKDERSFWLVIQER